MVVGPLAGVAAPPMRQRDTEFTWAYTDEPHASRRVEMLRKYPKMKELFGPCPWLRAKAVLVPLVQLGVAWLVRDVPMWVLLLVMYTWGASISCHTTLVMHEASHNLLGVRRAWLSRLAGMVSTVPLGIPAFMSFLRYHLEHHRYQGEDAVDTDLPTEWETRTFTTPLRKTLWFLMQPLFYAFRPSIVNPKVPGKEELLNLLVVLAYDVFVFYFLGLRALLFVLLSGPVATALHPLAGHFVAEHYTFERDQETYSYYGPLNWLSQHVGYHNEHHDFPNVAGPKLHKVRQLAPEYYDSLPRHSSWTRVVYQYIMSPDLGPHRRVKRQRLFGEELSALNKLALGRAPAPQPDEAAAAGFSDDDE